MQTISLQRDDEHCSEFCGGVIREIQDYFDCIDWGESVYGKNREQIELILNVTGIQWLTDLLN